ncbi:hypothetical protein C8J57DRAFT_1243905 [Mycena rebaudengoi]|nr:hypothetical protein C8J57DRAFT_1243905 [Mycena rebaudengoi]
MRNLFSLLLVLGRIHAQRTTRWTFVQNGLSGVIPVELITISPTLMLMYDRADGNPLLLPDGERAWAALWNLKTNTPTPISSITDTFCAGGAFISNGILVSVAGQPLEQLGVPPADGRMGIRLFGPCTSPIGAGCAVFEDPAHIHLVVTRWYPAGSFVLPSGHVFVIANNITMLYDIATDTETRLPELPNGVRVAHPFDGAAQLLPLSLPLYEPTVLVCGGSATDSKRPVTNLPITNLITQDPATNQCSRITLTPAGIAKGWEVELMPETRILMESVMLPPGDVLLINGAHTSPDIRAIRMSATPRHLIERG